MSRFLSLSRQRRTCGRLTRTLIWFEGSCKGYECSGVDEVIFGKAVGMAQHVGCAADKKAMDGLVSLVPFCERQKESKGVRGRVLVCAALLAQHNKEMVPDLVECFKNDFRLGSMALQGTESTKHTAGFPIGAILQRASDLGDMYGMALVGSWGMKANGFVQKQKSFELLERASEMGNAEAMVNVGYCFENGYGVPQDKTKAFYWFQQAAKLGSVRGLFNLAGCYLNGDGVSQDKHKAIELHKQAADMGDDYAMLKLGNFYAKGDGVPKNETKALELYSHSADLGNSYAMFKLAVSYGKGYRVSQEKQGAFYTHIKEACMRNSYVKFFKDALC